MESVEETTQEKQIQGEVTPSQAITRVTKQKRIKDSQIVSASKIRAAVREHNLKQKLLNDIKGRKIEPALGFVVLFNQINISPTKAKQIIYKKSDSARSILYAMI